MKIKVYAICWNEEIMAPYFLNHYQSITKDIVIYDNYSDDNTCDILSSCEIRKYDTDGKIRDDIYLEIKNNAWKECKGQYDWVIVCDMDELVYCNNLLLALKKAKENGFTAIQPTGYAMIGEKLPTTKSMIYDEINKGVKDINFHKCCIINPTAISETNYRDGCHFHNLEGEVKIWQTNDIKILHYHYLSLAYVIERYAKYKERLSDENIKNNWGIHYTFKVKKIIKEYEGLAAQSYKVIRGKIKKDKITFALTSCGRFKELKNTLQSFFKYNTAPIDRYIIIEDSGDVKMKEKCIKLNKEYNNKFEFIFNPKRIGQISSIDNMYETIDTEYVFHCEDDWEFYNKGFIEKSMKILKSDDKILMTWLRELDDTNGHEVEEKIYNIEDIKFKRLSTFWREGWGGFSFNPGLRRLKQYYELKPYRRMKQQFWSPLKFPCPELELSMEYARRGYYATIMLEGSVKHTGWNNQCG